VPADFRAAVDRLPERGLARVGDLAAPRDAAICRPQAFDLALVPD
jgi:hypothetical protein